MGESYRLDYLVSCALHSRALSPVVGLSDDLRAIYRTTPLSAAPQSHSLRSGSSTAATFQSQLLPPEPKSECGRLGRTYLSSVPHRRWRTCPYPEWGSLLRCCVSKPGARGWQRVAIQRGGGAAFTSSFLSPPTPPEVRERRVPGQSEGGAGSGGGVGSGLCPDTCLPRRPGPAGAWREGNPGPPAPHNPHVSKGG